MTACPRCARPNAPHRETCLYCGERMPNPTAPPPPVRRKEVPANLDALVRRAMRGEGVDALRKALEESKEAPPPDEPAVEPDLPEVEPEPDPLAAFDALVAAATAARNAARLADPVALEHALSQVEGALADVRALAPAPVELPTIRLPKVRHPWGLGVSAVPETFADAALAAVLETDVPTARQLRLAGHAKVALRGPDRAPLDRRAGAVRAAGLRARVLEADQLLALGPALAVVGVDAVDAWRLVEAPLWEDRLDPSQLPRGVAHALSEPTLLVPGEVTERRVAALRDASKWERARYAPGIQSGGERRLAVLDVHVDGRILRLVEGGADLRALPGADPASQRRSLAALLGALVARWPGLPVEPRRVCGVSNDPRAPDGWAEWEEHSRVCALLQG